MSWLKSLGYQRNEVIGEWFGEFLHHEQKEVFRKLFPVNIQSREPIYGLEFTLKRKDGLYIIAEYTSRIGRDAEGKFVRTHCVFRDITDRKRAEEALREREAKNRFHSQLLHAVEQAVIATDLQGHIIYWNAFAEKLFGWPYKDALGKTTIELIATESSVDQGEKIMEELRKGRSWSGEYLCRHRNGTEIPIFVTNSPIHDENGKLTGLIGVSIDITERKQAEEALRESENKFRTVAEQSPNMVFINQKGRIVYVNDRCHKYDGV